MREILFRAYDTYTKTMLHVVDAIKFTKSESINIIRDGAYGVALNMPYQPHIIFMQYTGLKDKNGKKIFEGDIVRTHFIGGNGVENDEVIYDGGCFCVNYSEDYHPLLNEVNHCSEVIGNIYENPELLKGE